MQQILPWGSFPQKPTTRIGTLIPTDKGHVNNAVFALFWRPQVEMLYQNEAMLNRHGNSYAIASLQLDLVAEIKWPGTVEIGTAVSKSGQ